MQVNYTLKPFTTEEKFQEYIPTTNGDIFLDLDENEIGTFEFSMRLLHLDQVYDIDTKQNYQIDYTVNIDNSGMHFICQYNIKLG